MAGAELFVYTIIGFIFGLILFIKGFIWLKQKRLIENMPTSKVRSIAMGLVEIFGKVAPSKILKSPFSNKDCVYYKYTIEEYRRTGKHSRWVTVKKGEEVVHFYLEDDTGKVLIDPKGANVDIPLDFQFNSGLGKDPPLLIKQFLKSNNMGFETFLGINKTMRYTEYFISPNDKLYIMGTAGDNPFVKEGTAKKGVDDVMIQKGKDEKFYYITDKPEREILKTLRWKVAGGIFGGSALSIVCLALILMFLKLL